MDSSNDFSFSCLADYVYAYDETGHDVKGKCRIPRKTPDNRYILFKHHTNLQKICWSQKGKNCSYVSSPLPSSYISDREVQKEPGSSSSKVPVVCLERLKILVSRIPPQGRRQSDPLPDTATERTGPVPQRGWKDKMTEVGSTKTLWTLFSSRKPMMSDYTSFITTINIMSELVLSASWFL